MDSKKNFPNTDVQHHGCSHEYDSKIPNGMHFMDGNLACLINLELEKGQKRTCKKPSEIHHVIYMDDQSYIIYMYNIYILCVYYYVL